MRQPDAGRSRRAPLRPGGPPRIIPAPTQGPHADVRILSILTYYDPHWTGLTAHAQRLAEGLARRGHEVTVLTSRYARDLAPEQVLRGVRVVRVPALARVSRGVIMPTFLLAAWRHIRTHDVVQFHTPILEAWLITTLARRAGKKALMTHHGDLVMPGRLLDRIVERSVTGMMMRAGLAADAVSVYSRDYADHSAFLRPFRAKHVYIQPSIEIPVPDRPAAAAWKRALGLEGARVVGFAGRFVEEKGFDILLRAIPLVLERVPNARFVYAGETQVVYERFHARWRHLIERHRDHVVMLGLILDRQRLAQFYAMGDVFALPSRTDALAAVQVEAMLCGTPVVASDIAGAREAVRLTGMGRLVRPEDPRALADGLAEVALGRERFVRSRDAVRAVFDPERSVDEYEALLGALAGGATVSR
jgi:glycosyltransferase involved in cell wall biosynthesis